MGKSMGKSWELTPIALLVLGLGLGGVTVPVRAESLTTLIQKVSVAESENDPAIAKLRSQGPDGLQAFLAAKAQELNQPGLPDAQLRTVLDQLCQQRDCHASQLYWYTDLEAAKAAARASGKPILSLRLLGQLDEELSCANSRFFRIALYANGEVSQALRDRVILHWESVRPVPVITVDFGDGRTIKRTVTGNSIHYLLDAEGRPLDALPGLYGPQAFLAWLDRAVPMAEQFAQAPVSEKNEVLQRYHRDRIAAIQAQWQADLAALNLSPAEALEPMPALDSLPDAGTAGRVAIAKMVVESPLLLQMGVIARNQQTLNSVTNIDTWQKLAQRYADQARLDTNSLRLMQSKNPALQDTAKLRRVQRQFEQMMALDTIRNEYQLHHQLHQWLLLEGPTTQHLNILNDRVYAQLFLTPKQDPWMGLAPDSVYSAIDNGGLLAP